MAQASHLARVFAQYPIEVVSAEGVWLKTRDGRRVLDLYGGHAVAAIGYGGRGTNLLHDLLGIPGVQVNAVCDLVKARVERAQSRSLPAS